MKRSYLVVPLVMFFASASMPALAQAISWQSIIVMLRTVMTEASAWAGYAMQTALTGKQKSEALINSQQTLASSITALSLYDRTMKAALDYHPTVGQPSSLKCNTQMEHKFRVESEAQSSRDAVHLMQTFSASRVDSPEAAQKSMWSMHTNTYCTRDEALQKLCDLSANGMQGWDVDYGAAFASKTFAPEGELAAYAYTAMLTDARASAFADCQSAACNAASAAQLDRAAQASMAAAVLVGQATDRRVPVLTGR